MRVLFVENAGNYNAGAFHSLIALIRLLRKYDVISYVALPDRANGKQMLKDNEIPYIELRSCSYTWMIAENAAFVEKLKMPIKDIFVKIASYKLADYIRKNHIEIVHENTSACYIGAFAAQIAKVKHVWHIREFMEEDFNNHIWWRKRAIELMDKSDAVIAISDAIQNKYKNILSCKRLIRIYNGIIIDEFYNPKRIIFANSDVCLLCVGRVCEGKGQKDLILAAGDLKERYRITPQIFFAGSYTKEIYNDYLKIAKNLKIDTQIKFLGQVNDMSQLYNTADIFCMCSKCEAFGRVTAEAMLSGNLIIGANSGGTPELLKGGKYGLLYSVGNFHELADRIAYAISNPDMMRKLSDMGREYARETFDARYNAERIYYLYKRLLEKKEGL